MRKAVTDASGQETVRVKVSSGAGLNKIRPDVSKWPYGLMLAKIVAGNQVMHHRMIRLSK